MSKKTGTHVDPERTDWFTFRENELLRHLKELKVVTEVARRMGISYRRAEEILRNIRRKWVRSVNTNNQLLSMSKGDSAFRKLLCQPAKRIPEIEREVPTPIQAESSEEE